MNHLKLKGKTSTDLFKYLEALFQANHTLSQMAQSIDTIAKNKEINLAQSFCEEKFQVINSKIVLNNNAIIAIEKVLSKRMKETLPGVFVFSDIDKFNRSINESVDKEIEKNKSKKSLEKPTLKKT